MYIQYMNVYVCKVRSLEEFIFFWKQTVYNAIMFIQKSL